MRIRRGLWTFDVLRYFGLVGAATLEKNMKRPLTNPLFGMKAVPVVLGRLMVTSVVCDSNHTSSVSAEPSG